MTKKGKARAAVEDPDPHVDAIHAVAVEVYEDAKHELTTTAIEMRIAETNGTLQRIEAELKEHRTAIVELQFERDMAEQALSGLSEAYDERK